jgi:hypothetical protein
MEPLGGLIEAIHLLEESMLVSEHQQRMEQMSIMAEAIPTTTDGLGVLPLYRQIEVVGYVLDDLIARIVGIDVPGRTVLRWVKR